MVLSFGVLHLIKEHKRKKLAQRQLGGIQQIGNKTGIFNDL